MSLFKHIEASVSNYWHNAVAPWLTSFLSNIVHHEVEAVLPIATQFAAQEAAGFATAMTTGDLSSFASSQTTVFLSTVKTLETTGMKVLGTSVSTAVTAAIAALPVTNPTVQSP